MTLWIDADACPKIIKEIVFKAALRLSIPVRLVANSYLNIPLNPLFTFIQVQKGSDEADKYIVEQVKTDDLVITADIPLAALIVGKGATAINPRGTLYTEENVKEKLSTRDFMQSLRDTGLNTGGPAPLGNKDKAQFANSFDKELTRLNKK